MAQPPPDISSILAALARPTSGPPGQTNHPPALPPGYPGAAQSTTPSNPMTGFSLPQPTNSGSLDLSAIKPGYEGRTSAPQGRDDPRLAGRPSRRSRTRSRSPARRDNYRNDYNPYRDERRDDPRRGQNGYGRDRSYSPRREPVSPGLLPHGTRSPIRNPDGSETITVDSSLVGLIIGRQGENLRRVEQETQARVQFVTGPEGAGTQRQCKISGTPRQIDDAKREIFRVVEENPQAVAAAAQQQAQRNTAARPSLVSSQSSNQPALREGEKSVQIMVPDRTVGLIIGRGGETIRDLQDRSGCHVNIVGENKSVNGLRPVNLIGSREAATKAKDLIMEIVESDTRTASGPPAAAAPQPYSRGFDPYMQNTYGSSEKINDRIVVPSDAVGMIIGKGGETIKQMQDTTGCKINVSPPTPPDIEREIGLIGSRMAIEAAKRAIWDKVETAREKSGSRSRGPPPPREVDPYSAYAPAPPSYGQPPPYGQPPYGQPPPQAQPMHGPIPGEAPPGDPYAAYGGYQNYMAMWYAALAAQQGQGEPPRPPGA